MTSIANSVGQQVFYIDTNRHVRDLRVWGCAEGHDLTALAITSFPGPIPGNPDVAPDEELVHYVGSSGHVCELAWFQGWEHGFDLTAMSGGTLAIAFGALTGFSDANGQNVFYLCTNGHVIQLHLSRGGVWSNPDLTVSFGGLQPFGSMRGNVKTNISPSSPLAASRSNVWRSSSLFFVFVDAYWK